MPTGGGEVGSVNGTMALCTLRIKGCSFRSGLHHIIERRYRSLVTGMTA